jgi:hypothetical protein
MSTICKNCGTKFEGNYCSNCGQAAHTHAINSSFVVHDLQHGLIHFDGGMLYSARQLFQRPGHAIRDYIEGKRVKHYKPISMLIVLATFYGLLYHALHINVFEQIDDNLLEYDEINEWIAHRFPYIILLSLPVMSLSSFLIFKKQGYNFTEHLILNSFYSTQKLWVRLITLPLLSLSNSPEILMQWLLLGDFVLMFWCYMQFFSNLSKPKVFFLTLLTTLLNLVIVAVVTTAVLMFLMGDKLG